MDATIQNALNDQIQTEFDSAYLYLSMAAYFEALNLPGATSWMKKQAQEEIEHGMKIFDYVNKKNGRVILQALPSPKNEFDSVKEVFETSLAHEQHVTQLIHKLYELANKQKDYSLTVFLQWFIEEQNEEEAQVIEILAKLNLLDKDSREGLLLIDHELQKR